VCGDKRRCRIFIHAIQNEWEACDDDDESRWRQTISSSDEEDRCDCEEDEADDDDEEEDDVDEDCAGFRDSTGHLVRSGNMIVRRGR
jgi:hypothetical protein